MPRIVPVARNAVRAAPGLRHHLFEDPLLDLGSWEPKRFWDWETGMRGVRFHGLKLRFESLGFKISMH